MVNKRILYLDVAKFFAIFLVVLGHCIQMMSTDKFSDNLLYKWIYTFHMPLFMIMSGYFASSSLKNNIFHVIYKKFVQLIVPAITCTVICLIYLFFVRNDFSVRDEIIGNSWFLKTLFLNYIVFVVVKKIKLPDWILFLVSQIIIFLIPHSYSLQFSYLYFFFWIGYLLRKYDLIFQKYRLLILFFSFLIYCISYVIMNIYNVNINILPSYGTFNMLPVLALKYLMALFGSIFVISLCYYLCISQNRLIRRIANIGQLTLGIYVIQTLFLINILPDISFLYFCPVLMLDVFSVIMSIFVISLCVCVIRILIRSRFLCVICFGGQYRK